MSRPATNIVLRKNFAASLAGLSIVLLALFSGSATGARLVNREVPLSNDGISATASYDLSFQIATAGPLGSIDIMFCSNDPLIEDACVQPVGMDVSTAIISNQTGEIGFSVSGASTANNLILTRTASPALAQAVTYQLDNIINPSTGGSYYVRVQTYATEDATGPSTDYGGMAFSITDNLSITSEVPPYILFCAAVTVPAFSCNNASGSIVELGNISSTSTSSGQSQMLVATNAANGYTVYMKGTSLTSGNDVISSLALPTSPSTGFNQFGLNLRANLSPGVGQDPVGPGGGMPTTDYNQPNRFKFVSNDVIAGSSSAEDYRRYTVSYIADANKSQAPGTYVSTITYVCVGNF